MYLFQIKIFILNIILRLTILTKTNNILINDVLFMRKLHLVYNTFKLIQKKLK